MRIPKAPKVALFVALFALCGLALGGWRPAPTGAGLPTAGLRGQVSDAWVGTEHLTGLRIGYCVTLEGFDGSVGVPLHAIERDTRRRMGLPPLDLAEFRDSVRNAAKLAARMSEKSELIAAAEGKIRFPGLGDVPSAEDTMICECARTNCWGHNSSCKVTKCGGACGDCVRCAKLAPVIEGIGPVDGPGPPPNELPPPPPRDRKD